MDGQHVHHLRAVIPTYNPGSEFTPPYRSSIEEPGGTVPIQFFHEMHESHDSHLETYRRSIFKHDIAGAAVRQELTLMNKAVNLAFRPQTVFSRTMLRLTFSLHG